MQKYVIKYTIYKYTNTINNNKYLINYITIYGEKLLLYTRYIDTCKLSSTICHPNHARFLMESLKARSWVLSYSLCTPRHLALWFHLCLKIIICLLTILSSTLHSHPRTSQTVLHQFNRLLMLYHPGCHQIFWR